MKKIFEKIKDLFTLDLIQEEDVMYDIPLTILEVKSVYFAIENNEDETLDHVKQMLGAAIKHYEKEIDV